MIFKNRRTGNILNVVNADAAEIMKASANYEIVDAAALQDTTPAAAAAPEQADKPGRRPSSKVKSSGK